KCPPSKKKVQKRVATIQLLLLLEPVQTCSRLKNSQKKASSPPLSSTCLPSRTPARPSPCHALSSAAAFANRTSFSERAQLMSPVITDCLFKSVLCKGVTGAPPVTTADYVLFHLTAYFATTVEEEEKHLSALCHGGALRHDVLQSGGHWNSTDPSPRRPLCRRPGHLLLGYGHALLTMVLGEVAEFAVHHSLAYGPLGSPPRIPPAADLIVILEVVDVHSPGSLEHFFALEKFLAEEEDDDEEEEHEEHFTPQQILAYAREDRELGNAEYRADRFTAAHAHFRRTMEMLERRSRSFVTTSEVEDEAKRLLLSLYTSANCCVLRGGLSGGGGRNGQGPTAVNYARRALRIDPYCARAFFQLGKGYLAMDKLRRAADSMLKAARLRPRDPDIAAEVRRILRLQAELNMKRSTREDLEEEDYCTELVLFEGAGEEGGGDDDLEEAPRFEDFDDDGENASPENAEREEKVVAEKDSPWSIHDMLEALDDDDLTGDQGDKWHIDDITGGA
ncbi:Inactive peptidyl-prolyl cis-trans isomerase fkbp6, partial [Tyrophagus putrescentiae]